jgi:NADPH-dependent 2,4-dienoyl-CoA reductase/sulfur reductase-like enzyme/ferredoxin
MTTHSNGASPPRGDIVIAGGGLAGQRCAETLRRAGYEGAIRMVCAELHPPYDRPPLSKAALIHGPQASKLCYRAESWYDEQSVDLLLGVSAAGLEPDRSRLLLSDGTRLPYARLLIATGACPRTLPMLAGYDNVSALRTVEDAQDLHQVLAAGRRLAVIGGGFIGLEIAASARQLAVPVTIIEAASAPLEAVLGPKLGGWFQRLHTEEGVDVRTQTTVEHVIGGASVRALRLRTGAVVEADHVVVGVGIAPAVDWLRGSGVLGAAGVHVDAGGRTCVEHVFAAGDAASTFHPDRGCYVPGSHWEAAGRHGARVAKRMLGLDPGPAPLTSFWTDQYDLRIQYVGLRARDDEVAIDGDMRRRDFTASFSRAGRVVAALLVNRPHQLPAARQSIERGHMPYSVEVDETACAAHGDCVDVAPEVFNLDDVAQVIGTGPDELLLEAAQVCPSTAIRIIDVQTDEQVYP